MSGEAFLWYKLFHADGFGPKAMQVIWEAIQRGQLCIERLFGLKSPEFEANFPMLGKGRLKGATFESLQSLDEDTLQEEYQALKEESVELVHPGHPLFPESVGRPMEHGVSPILFCKGALSLLKSRGVAIVGSRKASDEGIDIARQFGADLALHGENVISGYAKGIDTAAHQGALEKDGTTTIILSLGILQFSKKKTFDGLDLEKNVLMVSQFRPSAGWSPANAMIRNKLVCALSKAVIVVESGPEIGEDGSMSGTFDAGKTALEMGIPLFVVSPRSLKKPPPGNKALLNRGAIEIDPDDGIEKVLACVRAGTGGQEDQPATGEQLMLL